MVIFGILSAIAITCGLAVILANRPIYSIIALILCLYAIGGIYLALHAEFLAIVHLIVYAGAIMVLFLFVIMLMNLDRPKYLNRSKFIQWLAIGSATGLGIVVTSAIVQTPAMKAAPIGSVTEIGKLLFTKFLVPFELSTVLFLSAVIGVVITAKSPTGDPDQ